MARAARIELRIILTLGHPGVKCRLRHREAATCNGHDRGATDGRRGGAAKYIYAARAVRDFFAAGFEAWPRLICGLLKTIYDIGLLWAFRHVNPPEER